MTDKPNLTIAPTFSRQWTVTEVRYEDKSWLIRVQKDSSGLWYFVAFNLNPTLTVSPFAKADFATINDAIAAAEDWLDEQEKK